MKVSKKNTEHSQWGKKCDGWHLLKNKSLSIIQESMPAGSIEVKHYHQESEQFFYVLKGNLTIKMEDKIHSIHSTEGLHIPPKVAHQIKNSSDEVVEFLVISVPPSDGDRVLVD